MNIDIEIRAAKFGDREAMIQLQVAALKSISKNYYQPMQLIDLIQSKRKFYEQGLYYYDKSIDREHDQNITLVATIFSKIVGFAALEDNRITAIFVAPQYIRQKIATRLLEALELKAIDRAIPTLVVASSLNAQGFYNSCGYRFIRRDRISLGFNLRQISVINMEKRLLPSQPNWLWSYLTKWWRTLKQLVKIILG